MKTKKRTGESVRLRIIIYYYSYCGEYLHFLMADFCSLVSVLFCGNPCNMHYMRRQQTAGISEITQRNYQLNR